MNQPNAAEPQDERTQGQPQFYTPISNANHFVQQASYEGHDLNVQPLPAQPKDQVISWEASEYVHNAKGFGWILGLIGVAAVLVALAVWLGAWTFAVLIVVMAIAMGIFAFRPPRVLHYTLTGQGLQVDDKPYAFSDFRAFGILQEGAFYTIMLIPTKRFMPAVNIYFAEADGEKIVDILGSRLPMEQLNPDPLDHLMRRLRF